MDTTRIGYGASPRPAGIPQNAADRMPARAATPVSQASGEVPAAGNAPAQPSGPDATSRASTRGSRDDIQKLLEEISSQIQPESRALTFKVNEEADRVVVSVIDANTDELIRQIPAESIVRVAEALREYNAPIGSTGFLLEDQA